MRRTVLSIIARILRAPEHYGLPFPQFTIPAQTGTGPARVGSKDFKRLLA